MILRVQVRRFRCGWPDCARKIFAERLDPSLARTFGRRTERLEGIVHHIGVALGGRPGERTAGRLLLPASKDTLLRTVRRRARAPGAKARVVGVDDWAWRKGHRYGTVICDLERRVVLDLLPDREPATVAAWLAARPSIEIIAGIVRGKFLFLETAWIFLIRSKKVVKNQWRKNSDFACGRANNFPLTVPI